MTHTAQATGLDTVATAAEDPQRDQPWADLGLKADEYQRIREILGRRPTSSELAMYSVMWSEHCSYKSSKVHLRRFGDLPPSDALLVERADTAWTSSYTAGQQITVPVKNGEGRFVAAEADLDRLEGEGRVVVRYAGGNPNGSSRDIAGVCSADGRVVGLMPHPEHAVEDLTGPGTDGLGFFTSVLRQVVAA